MYDDFIRAGKEDATLDVYRLLDAEGKIDVVYAAVANRTDFNLLEEAPATEMMSEEMGEKFSVASSVNENLANEDNSNNELFVIGDGAGDDAGDCTGDGDSDGDDDGTDDGDDDASDCTGDREGDGTGDGNCDVATEGDVDVTSDGDGDGDGDGDDDASDCTGDSDDDGTGDGNCDVATDGDVDVTCDGNGDGDGDGDDDASDCTGDSDDDGTGDGNCDVATDGDVDVTSDVDGGIAGDEGCDAVFDSEEVNIDKEVIDCSTTLKAAVAMGVAISNEYDKFFDDDTPKLEDNGGSDESESEDRGFEDMSDKNFLVADAFVALDEVVIIELVISNANDVRCDNTMPKLGDDTKNEVALEAAGVRMKSVNMWSF